MVGDMSAAMGAMMTRIGECTGLYKALAGAGWLNAEEVAARAGCDARYAGKRFRLPDEHAYSRGAQPGRDRTSGHHDVPIRSSLCNVAPSVGSLGHDC